MSSGANNGNGRYLTPAQGVAWLASSLSAAFVAAGALGTWALDNHSQQPHPSAIRTDEFERVIEDFRGDMYEVKQQISGLRRELSERHKGGS